VGCIDSGAPNYDPTATIPVAGTSENPSALGGCDVAINGCTNTNAQNYVATANVDDSTCQLVGCMNPIAPNYVSWATTDSGNCDLSAVGCTDSDASNYQSEATADAGNCLIVGCTESTGLNYDPKANSQGEVCVPTYPGCTYSGGWNYSPLYNVEDGSCQYFGCTDSTKFNFDPITNIDLSLLVEGSCRPLVYGCTAVNSYNYDSNANAYDYSCIPYPSPPNVPQPSAPPPLPSSPPVVYIPPPGDGFPNWAIALAVILPLSFIIAGVGCLVHLKYLRIAQVSIIPDVGERTLVQPPPLPQ